MDSDGDGLGRFRSQAGIKDGARGVDEPLADASEVDSRFDVIVDSDTEFDGTKVAVEELKST